jgi:hypothetical protein
MDAARALLVGALHLVRLFAQLHSDGNWFPNWLIVHTGRAVSKLLDLMQTAEQARTVAARRDRAADRGQQCRAASHQRG